jgi:hypothetical protein
MGNGNVSCSVLGLVLCRYFTEIENENERNELKKQTFK